METMAQEIYFQISDSRFSNMNVLTILKFNQRSTLKLTLFTIHAIVEFNIRAERYEG